MPRNCDTSACRVRRDAPDPRWCVATHPTSFAIFEPSQSAHQRIPTGMINSPAPPSTSRDNEGGNGSPCSRHDSAIFLARPCEISTVSTMLRPSATNPGTSGLVARSHLPPKARCAVGLQPRSWQILGKGVMVRQYRRCADASALRFEYGTLAAAVQSGFDTPRQYVPQLWKPVVAIGRMANIQLGP